MYEKNDFFLLLKYNAVRLCETPFGKELNILANIYKTTKK